MILNVLDPIKYPESIKPLLQCLHIADTYLFCVNSKVGLDKHFAETILALDLWNDGDIERGIIALTAADQGFDPAIEERVRKVIRTTRLAKTEIIRTSKNDSHSVVSLKEKMFALANKTQRVRTDAPLEVWIDAAFPVQGVGTVILGKIMAGHLQRGMTVKLMPSRKNVVVRSIQLNDVDEKEASAGSHIGLALKGISPEEAWRGSVLVDPDDNLDNFDKGDLSITLNKYSSEIVPEMKFHLAYGLEFLPVTITEVRNRYGGSANSLSAGSAGTLGLKLEREVAKLSGVNSLLCDLNRMPRILGKGEIR